MISATDKESLSSANTIRFQILLFDFLYHLYRDFRRDLPLRFTDRRFKSLSLLEPVIEYTKQNYHLQISIPEISNIASLHPNISAAFSKSIWAALIWNILTKFAFPIFTRISPPQITLSISCWKSMGLKITEYFAVCFTNIFTPLPAHFEKN